MPDPDPEKHRVEREQGGHQGDAGEGAAAVGRPPGEDEECGQERDPAERVKRASPPAAPACQNRPRSAARNAATARRRKSDSL